MATPIIGRNLAGLIEEQVQSVFIPLPTAACSRNVLVLQIERALYKRRAVPSPILKEVFLNREMTWLESC
jgi:hypothetical protein